MSARPFTVVECEQRSEAWHTARLGRLTGSRSAGAFMKTQAGKWSANRKNLIAALVLERITGLPQDDRGPSRALNVRDGVAREPFSVFSYECLTGTIVRSCGFVADDDLPIGVSLDGYLGDFEGIIECKGPIPATHLETLKARQLYRVALEQIENPVTIKEHFRDQIPEIYRWQIKHGLYCTGAYWCDYISHHPAFPEHLRSVIIRVTREDAAAELVEYEGLVRDFLAEVDAEYTRVMEMSA